MDSFKVDINPIVAYVRKDSKLKREYAVYHAKLKTILLSIDEKDIILGLKKLEKEYDEHRSNMIKRIQNFKKTVQSFKDSIVEYATNGSNLQKLLENFEDSMTKFKKAIIEEYDRLELESSKLYSDLLNDNVIIDEFDINNQNEDNEKDKAVNNIVSVAEKDIANRAIIGGIDRQLTALGRYGGWDDRDHDIFLKVWIQLGVDIKRSDKVSLDDLANQTDPSDSAYNRVNIALSIPDNNNLVEVYSVTKRNVFVRKVVKLLPGISLSDIEEHIDWYVKVAKLMEIKKKFLGEWKQVRQKDAIEKLEEIETEILRPDGIGPTGGSANPDAQLILEQQYRQKTKNRIEQWKKKRQDEELTKKREEAEKREQETRKLNEQQRERQLAMKNTIKKWKDEEAITKTVKASQAETSNRRASSADPAEMARRRSKSVEYGKQKYAKIVQKSNESNIRETKQKEMEDNIAATLFTKIKRDVKRVQGSTKASEAQQLSREYLDDITDKRLQTGAHGQPIALTGRDLKFGIRATPAWLQRRRRRRN